MPRFEVVAAGQQAAQPVEGPRLDGPAPGGLARPGLVGHDLGQVPGQGREQLGVGGEQPVHHPPVLRAEVAGLDVRVEVVAPAAPRPVGVGDVAGRLLQVGGQPAPLEQLGEQVGRLLAGHVGPAQLGHRVVPVVVEDPLVQRGRPGHPDLGGRRLLPRLDLVGELVQEQPAQGLARAGVAGEQRPLDRLGQVAQGEHRPVEVGDVRGQAGPLVGGELLDPVGRLGLSGHPSGPNLITTAPAAARGRR